MGLEEALQAFENNYRAPNSSGRFHELNIAGSRNLIEDLSLLNDKIRVSAKPTQEQISLRPYILPVPLPAQKLKLWKTALPSGVCAVSHHTFCVTLNGKHVIVRHGIPKDKRYFSNQGDTAVLATEAEAGRAISLDVRPSTCRENRYTEENPDGERVRFGRGGAGAGAVAGALPDLRMSFHG
jgi:hypothetical protein